MLNHWKIQNSGDSQDAINSIRGMANNGERATKRSQWRQSSMTVFHLEAVRGGSNVPILGHFWRFLGIWAPKCCRPSCGPPKKHFLTSQRAFWATVRQNPPTGHFSRRVRGKTEIKKRPYISRISPGAPLWPTGTNFGLRVHLVDVINCAKFYRNRLRGLDSVRGWSLTIPTGLRCRR